MLKWLESEVLHLFLHSESEKSRLFKMMFACGKIVNLLWERLRIRHRFPLPQSSRSATIPPRPSGSWMEVSLPVGAVTWTQSRARGEVTDSP